MKKKLMVIEDGYFKDRFLIKPDKLKKLLKTLLKREFPRSKKIRLYVMGKFVDEEAFEHKTKNPLEVVSKPPIRGLEP